MTVDRRKEGIGRREKEEDGKREERRGSRKEKKETRDVLREIPFPDLQELAYFSGREVKTLFS